MRGTVVDSVTNQPLAKVQIGVLPETQLGTVTDALGRWQISGLPCGSLNIVVSRRGYLRKVSQAGTVGETTIRLEPVAQVSGQVLDDTGEPLEYASVMVHTLIPVNGRWAVREGLRLPADARGMWNYALTPGRYIFCASGTGTTYPAGGGEALHYADQCLPGTPFGPAPSAMKLSPGQRASVDFVLHPARGVHVRGTVLGAPKNGWAVVHIGAPGADGSIWSPKATAIAEQGVFDLPGITAGRYLLEASAVDGDAAFSALLELEVGQGDVGGISLSLAPRVRLSGTVGIGSAAAGKAATPFPGAVSLKPVTPGASSGPTVWDEDRRSFTISHIVPGTYRVQVVAAPNIVTSVFLEGKEVTDELTIRQHTGPLEIRVNGETGSLEGTVKDLDGKPRAEVVLVTDGRSLRAMQKSGADGHFAVPTVGTGRYRAWVVDDQQSAAWAEPEWQRENTGAEVVITSGGTTKLDLVWTQAPPLI